MGWFGDLINQLDSWSPTKDLQHDLISEAGRAGTKVGDKWNWDWLSDESRWVTENPAAARAKGAQIAATWYLGSQLSGAGAAEGGGSGLTTSYGGGGGSEYLVNGGYGASEGGLLTSGGAGSGAAIYSGGVAGGSGAGGFDYSTTGIDRAGGPGVSSPGVADYGFGSSYNTPNLSAGGGMGGGGMFDSMQEYLRRMSRTPQGRMALARLAGGAYGANENRKLRKELRDVDITQQPGYRAGEQAVRRRLASQGMGNSGNMLTELQDYGGRFYKDYAENRRAEVGAKTGNLGNMMSLLSLMSTGG